MEEAQDRVYSAPLDDPRLIGRETAPGLARLVAGAVWRTNMWTLGAAVRATRRLGDAARSGESAVELVDDAREELLQAARNVLGVTELPLGVGERDSEAESEPLRERWDHLVEASTEVVDDADTHPAFADILAHLHPDEARILRLLATSGAQAAVDVRNWRPFGIGSHVIAGGLTMIGDHAGCLHVERTPAYLSNLFRLGLIWFARDAVPELQPYQVLEAQPYVTGALKEAGRGTTVRRSIRLTPFGEQFCSACLPEGTMEFEVLGSPEEHAFDAAPAPTADVVE